MLKGHLFERLSTVAMNLHDCVLFSNVRVEHRAQNTAPFLLVRVRLDPDRQSVASICARTSNTPAGAPVFRVTPSVRKTRDSILYGLKYIGKIDASLLQHVMQV